MSSSADHEVSHEGGSRQALYLRERFDSLIIAPLAIQNGRQLVPTANANGPSGTVRSRQEGPDDPLGLVQAAGDAVQPGMDKQRQLTFRIDRQRAHHGIFRIRRLPHPLLHFRQLRQCVG
jgi:hypothetical protein